MRITYLLEPEEINFIQPKILSAAVAEIGPEWALNCVTTPHSRLYYFIEGEAWMDYHGHRISMKPNHLYFIPAGLPFTTGCSRYAKKIYFHITMAREDGYDMAMQLHKICELPADAPRIEQILTLCEDHCARNFLHLKTLLMEDLSRIFRLEHLGGEPIFSHSAYVKKAMTYVQQHLSGNLTVQQLAQELFISERTLNNYFKNEMGKTVSQYIDELLMIKAQRRLLFTDLSVKEISEQLGFCDQFYFSRKFKEKCGKSPYVYRKETKTL